MQSVVEKIKLSGIIPVITVKNPEKAVKLVSAIEKGGLTCVEIAFRTKEAPAVLKTIRESLPEIIAGAGTVLTVDDASAAVSAGAQFIVSPGFTAELAGWCAGKNIPFFPGVDSPSQIQNALSCGLSILKFFPADIKGGTKMLKAMQGPFQSVQFIPTGGINTENLGEYMRLPNVLAAGGSWLVPEEAVENSYWDKITDEVKKAVLAVHGFQFRHLGINSENGQQAAEASAFFGSMGFCPRETDISWFNGTDFEIMKQRGRGLNGHIAIACNNLERALAFFEKRGFMGDESSARKDGNGLTFIYLNKEINGFAVHLVKK